MASHFISSIGVLNWAITSIELSLEKYSTKSESIFERSPTELRPLVNPEIEVDDMKIVRINNAKNLLLMVTARQLSI